MAVKKKYRDLVVGETFEVTGDCKVTVMHKTGARVRLLIESDGNVRFSTQAHKCRDSLNKEGDSHGTN